MGAFDFKLFGLPILHFESSSAPSQEARSIENPTVSLTDESSINEMFGLSSNSLTHDSALNYSAVWRAVSLLAGTIAFLPFQVYKKTDNGRDQLSDHPVNILVHSEPNLRDTAFKFFENLMEHLLLWGNSYSLIIRDKLYRPLSLKQYHPTDVDVFEYNNQIYYRVRGIETPVLAIDMIHVKGFGSSLKGKDPITVARESLETGLIMMKSSNSLFKHGHLNDRYVASPGVMKQDQYDRFKKDFDSKYGGWMNGGKAPILEGGMEIKNLSTSPENMQFLDSRKFHLSEVCRWFGVQPHKLFDLTSSTNNNIEHQGIEFVTDTVMLWTNRIEQEFSRKMFRNDERRFTYLEFNLNGLLKGDTKTRSEYYNKATGGRPWLVPDEIRELENMKKMGGDASELITPLNFKAPEIEPENTKKA
ncbi:MAG: phage portal protein [Bacteroidota bacterium]|nr:phage portal protein [Bacteroidota bacterium]